MTASNVAVLHNLNDLKISFVINRYIGKVVRQKMQSSSKAEAKVYFALFTFVLFDDNSTVCVSLKSRA